MPLSDSSVEIGVSAYGTGGTGDKGSEYEDVGAFLYAFDLSYVKQISAISGLLDLKAQYNNSKVDDAVYFDEHEDEFYTFNNQSDSYYVQLSYRPTMAGNDFLKNLEFVGRYSELNTPEESEWESEASQYSFGINYWLSWRSVLKLSYETSDIEGGHGGDGLTNIDSFSIHWAIGF